MTLSILSRFRSALFLFAAMLGGYDTANAQPAFGGSLSLAGVNQYISVPSGVWFSNQFTVEAWVFVRSYASWSRLMEFGDGPGTNNLICGFTQGTSGQPIFQFYNGSTVLNGSLLSSSTLPLNSWAHLAFTYDGTTGAILINGSPVATGPMTAPPNVLRTNNYIGRSLYPADAYANAIVNEFRLWSTARTPGQILADLGHPLTGNENNLILYYRFDEASGTVATNSAAATGAPGNGTWINSPGHFSSTAPASVVLNAGDSGAKSLRDVIATTAAGQYITFATNLSGATIHLTSAELLLNKNVTIDASALPGGISIDGGATLRVFEIASNTTVALNCLTISNGFNTYGGGILNSGNLTINAATLAGNSAFGGGAIDSVGSNASLVMLNCTVAANTAGFAGGIWSKDGILQLTHCTVAQNNGSGGSGGLVLENGSATLSNSIVAANLGAADPDIGGGGAALTLAGHNVVGQPGAYGGVLVSGLPNGSGQFIGDSVNPIDPMLSPLGNFGGPTATMPPLSHSVALDTAVYSTLATDQRGLPRPWNAGPDIGAAESLLPAPGAFGNALFFNGNQSVDVAGFGANSAPHNEVTVEFWAYSTGLADATFILNPDTATNRFFAAINGTDGKIRWDFGNSLGAGHVIANSAPNSISNWVHYAFVASQAGNYMRIYTNGNLFFSKVGMTPLVASNFTLRIGSGYSGRLDEFRVWDTALSQADILATMNTPLTGNEPFLALYFPFDSATGHGVTNLAGATGAANNGVAVNSPFPEPGDEPFTTGATPASIAYAFTTFAGGSSAGSADGVGDTARFALPVALAVDTNGNIFVSDKGNSAIRKITSAGVVSTFAGLAGSPGVVDGPGTTARFDSPNGIALDAAGNLYVADQGNDLIRKITSGGVVSTIGFATGPGLAMAPSGVIYSEDFYAIVKFTLVGTNWVKSAVAGDPFNLGATDGPGGSARFNFPVAMAADAAGNVYVTDGFPDYAIRQVTPAGNVTTIAGGTAGTADGLGTNAQFYAPLGIAVDKFTNIFVGDGFADTVRKITPVGTNWNVTTFAGKIFARASSDATGTNARFGYPFGVAVDNSSNVFVADNFNDNIRKITPAGVVSTLAGPGNSSSFLDGTGANARFNHPQGVTLDTLGNIYVADNQNHVIRKITSAGVVSTVAGQPGVPGTADGAGSDAQFVIPIGVVADNNGNLYVTGGGIRKITPAGVVTTLATYGNGFGYVDGTTNVAKFANPNGITVDNSGNLYIAEEANNTIRMIAPNGVVTTVAGLPEMDGSGNPIYGYDGNRKHFGGYVDGNGTNARFNAPEGIAIDGAGNLYVADSANFVIRKIIAPTSGSKSISTNWAVTTVAGVGGVFGSSDGVGAAARFGYSDAAYSSHVFGPTGVSVDSVGNLFVTDDVNNTIRKITPAGVVTTLAGLAGTIGSMDGTGSDVRFNAPSAITVDASGALYVVDMQNNTVRKGTFTQFGPANFTPIIQPPPVGQIQVTLLPPEAGGQWRFPWEQAWRNSGDTATNLVSGSYPIEFRAVPGYVIVPLAAPVALPVQGGLIQYTNQYFPTISAIDTNSGGGSLSISFVPSPPNGARWQFVGDTNLLVSGFTTNLPSGNYLISFTPVPGFVTPGQLSVQVVPEYPTVLLINYALAQSVPANFLSLPAPVPANAITDITNHPFGFNGRLQTDAGYGSGVAVKANVVLTAAHLVFDDQALDYVNQANWFLQAEQGVFSPDPLPARGWYILSGYAAGRTNDVLAFGPEVSTPQSRNADVAALYFQSPVAGGAYGGYLPSDAAPNPWLTGSANKMLVGYPVDGTQFGVSNIVNGLMYETGPQTLPLSLATDPIADQEVYKAPWLLSFPGNSGGPLYVELNGYYYPAGVYLGTLFNGIVPYASAVRAIDSNVVSLITLAASLGDTGTNNSGGGVITTIPSQSISRTHPGYLLLQLGPPSAVQAGAAWKLTNQPNSYFSTANPSLQAVITTNALAVGFKPIPGWNVPTNRSVIISPGLIVTNIATYTVSNPVVTLDLVRGLGITGTTNTHYQIQRNIQLNGGSWLPYKTMTITSNGINAITNAPTPGFYRALWLTN